MLRTASVSGSGRRLLLAWSGCLLLFAPVHAQELAPRAYWPAPRGTKVAILGYLHSSGDNVTDPSLPVSGVDSEMNSGLFAYLQTISLCGRSANFIVEFPYVWGTVTGDVFGEQQGRDLSGVGDAAVTLSVNLLGAPSMTPEDFRKLQEDPRPILGASLRLQAPTGEYDEDRLVNIGANRWAARAELGSIIPLQPRWLLELEAGTWFFDENDDFLGVTRKQDPIVSGEVHIIWSIKPVLWTALDLNYYTGGRTTVDGELRADRLRNSRIGFDVLWSFRPRHALKFGYSAGIRTDSGGDYDSLLLTYQVLLGGALGRGRDR